MADGDLWLVALVVAFLVTVVATPMCRWLAHRIGLVDQPARRKVHTRPVPYLGGVALAVGVVVGACATGALGERAGGLLCIGALAGAVGLLDDHQPLSPRIRLVAHVTAAVVLAVSGVGEGVVGNRLLDLVIAVAVIAGATNAVNLCDNMDALAASMAAATSTGCLLVALSLGQPTIAVLGASLGGACLGFIVFNGPPATVFMGDAGSTFLGCTLGAVTLETAAAVTDARGLVAGPVVGILLLGVFALDSAMVIVARPRNGRRISDAGKDHLSHRLVALGSGRPAAVGILAVVTAGLSTLGVLVASGTLTPLLAVAVAGAALAVLARRTWRADVYGVGKVIDLTARGATTVATR